MDRRFLTVLMVSLVFALLVSTFFYFMTASAGSAPKKTAELDMDDIVVAAKPLSLGVSIKPDDIRIVKMPVKAFPKGAFKKAEEVIDRPVVSNILLDEPILEGRLALRGSGMGLAPAIPVGMRAVSVRVNEVVGVAGFVLPGMHVDVLVTGRPAHDGADTMTTTALQDITVISAGQSVQADPRGQAINAPVVTLLVTPEQAEILTLAGNEAKIQLVLRNGSDKGVAATPGRKMQELYGIRGARPRAERNGEDGEDAPRRRRPRPVPVEAAPVQAVAVAPPPPPPPVPDQVVVIRGNQKSVEVVANAGGKN